MKLQVQQKVENITNANRSEIKFYNTNDSASLHIELFGYDLAYNFCELNKLSRYFHTSKIDVDIMILGSDLLVNKMNVYVNDIPGDIAHKLFPDMIKAYEKYNTDIILKTKYKDVYGGYISYGDTVSIGYHTSYPYDNPGITTYNGIHLKFGEDEWKSIWDRYVNGTWNYAPRGNPVNMSLYKRLLKLYENEPKELHLNSKNKLYFTVGDIRTNPVYKERDYVANGKPFWEKPKKSSYIDSYGGECWKGDQLYITFSHDKLWRKKGKVYAIDQIYVGDDSGSWLDNLQKIIDSSNGKEPTLIENRTLYSRLLEAYKISQVNNKED